MKKMNKTLLNLASAVCRMRRPAPSTFVLVAALILGLTTIAPAQKKNRFTDSTTLLAAKKSASADKQLVEQVSTNILKNARLPYSTQQPLIIVDQDDLTKYSDFEDLLNVELRRRGYPGLPKTNINQANAFAWDGNARLLRAAGFTVSNAIPDNEQVPMMVVTPMMMSEYIKSDASRLSLLVGHELSHIILKHYAKEPSSSSYLPSSGFSRATEEEADHEGLRLALLAKYDQTKMVEFARDFFAGTDHSAVGFSTHPSDLERLAYFDKKNGKYWEAYHTFVNGAFFLDFQDYATAESEFNKVVNMTKDSYEALNNRGYARLMIYIDNLETGDLQRFGIGHLLLAGYYKKPTTVIPKGVDKEIWQLAVNDLKEAEKLNKKSSLIQANLGLAYLIAPDNISAGAARTANFKTAFENFQKAIELMKYDTDDDRFKQAVYNNAAVAAIAIGDKESARLLLSLYENNITERTPNTMAPLAFNKALLAEIRKDYKTAFTELANFLASTSEKSKYRPYGQGKYLYVAGLAIEKPEVIPPLAGWAQTRGIYSVNYKGKVISLSTTVNDQDMKTLGCIEVAPSAPDEKGLVRYYNCLNAGMRIAAGGDRKEIILIRLFPGSGAGNAAAMPTINFGEKGINVLSKIGVGMTKTDFEKIAGPTWVKSLGTSDFYIYDKLNLFVRYESGRVAEILVRPLG